MKRLAVGLLRAPELITFVLLIVAVAIGAMTSPNFLDLNYLLDRSSEELIPIGLLAIAMTFLIIAGQIDLSVGSGAVLVMVISAMLYRDAGVPMGWVIVLAPLLGALLGLFNGVLVVFLRLPSLVVTLGTLALYRGIAKVMIGDASISGFPRWFVGINMREVGGVQLVPIAILLGLAIVAGVVLRFTTFGRRVYAIGTNEPAARFAAIRTGAVTLTLFTFSGVMMGLAGLMHASVMTNVKHDRFIGGELIAITAVVLGGTSIAGGRGGIVGTVLAILLLGAVSAALGINNVHPANQLAITGSLLIGSVVLNGYLNRFRVRLARHA